MRAALTETYLRLASERGDAALTKDERLLALSALFNVSPSLDSHSSPPTWPKKPSKVLARPARSKCSTMLDLSEHRLGQLLSEAVGAGVPAGPDFFAHGGDARAAAFSFACVLPEPLSTPRITRPRGSSTR